MSVRGKIKAGKPDPKTYRVSGIVTSTVDKVDYEFDQQYGVQLGIDVNDIVQFEIITDSAGKLKGVSLDPVEKGTIDSIDDLGNGVLIDRTGAKLSFQQDYSKELGIVKGVKVKYTIVNVDGKYLPTSLKLA
jgi:hypothetical protein